MCTARKEIANLSNFPKNSFFLNLEAYHPNQTPSSIFLNQQEAGTCLSMHLLHQNSHALLNIALINNDHLSDDILKMYK